MPQKQQNKKLYILTFTIYRDSTLREVALALKTGKAQRQKKRGDPPTVSFSTNTENVSSSEFEK